MTTIGQRIAYLRLQAGMTQDALAKRAGCSRVAVTKWESGDTENIKLGNLTALCVIFRTSYEYLITGRESSHVAHDAAKVVGLVAVEPHKNAAQERELIEGFRVCEDRERDVIMMIARRALADFQQRSETN